MTQKQTDQILQDKSMTTGKNRLATGRVLNFNDTYVVNGREVLQINICGKNPAHRKTANR